MKAITMSVLLGIALCSVSYADEASVEPVAEAYAEANQLLRDGTFADAQAAFESVISDYPDAPVELLAASRYHVGIALYRQRRFAEAETAFARVIADYPGASTYRLAYAQSRIGLSLRQQGDHAEALAAFAKVLSDYPRANAWILATTHEQLGVVMLAQGRDVEAAEAFARAATAHGFVNLAWQTQLYRRINPVHLGREGYIEYLTNLLMLVPATEANADFLGRVKSQLELIQ